MKNTLLLSAAALTLLMTSPVHAQTSDNDTADGVDEIVVTGTSQARTKFDTSYAVTTLDSAAIEKISPTSFADLVGQVPGIQVEASGGEVQNIFRTRGIPDEGNFISFQQDGLTLYQSGSGPFFTGDVLNRVDLFTERLEVVRGGSAPVFASNAAAIFNQITRRGGPKAEGAVKVTVGDQGLFRGEGYVSGPIAEDTYFAVGGFWRHNDGVRDPGDFPLDRGGQIRGNIRHEFDNGHELTVTGLYLNDNNQFFLPIPLADPRDPSVSLDSIIDAQTGTLTTDALRNVRFVYGDGEGGIVTQDRDIADGRAIEYSNIGVHYKGELAGWNINAKFGHGTGRLDFDAVYSIFQPLDAADLLADNLAGAQAAFGDISLNFAEVGSNGQTLFNPNAASLGLVNQIQYRTAESDFSSTTADLQFNRVFETEMGTHDFSIGGIASNYGASLLGRYQNYLTVLEDAPALLDIAAFDNSTGDVAGFVTDNGVLSFSNVLFGGDSDISLFGIWVNDSWQVTDKLRLDGGIRFEYYDIDGFGRDVVQGVDLGDPNTLADDSTRAFNGNITQRSGTVDVLPWSVGVNYDFTDNFGLYARWAQSNRLPFEVVGTIFNASSLEGTKARQQEIGLKYVSPTFTAYVTGFRSVFDPFNQRFETVNPATGEREFINFDGEAETIGVEGDVTWSPVDWFSINSTFTYGDPEYTSLVSDTGADPGEVEGNRIVRQAAFWGNITPTVNFDLSNDSNVEAYARVNWIGTRFVDLQNTTRLPAFQTLAAGVTLNKGDWGFSVVGDNLTNTVGLTEGNPLSDLIAGQGVDEAIFARPIFGRSVRFSVTKRW